MRGLKWLICGTIFVGTIVLTDGLDGFLRIKPLTLCGIASDRHYSVQLGDMPDSGVEYVAIINIGQQISEESAPGHRFHVGLRERTHRWNGTFWPDDLREMFFGPLVEKPPGFYQLGSRRGAFDQKPKSGCPSISAISEINPYGKSVLPCIRRFNHDRTEVYREMYKGALAEYESILGRLPLLSGVPGGGPSEDCSEHYKYEYGIFKPVFWFALGALLVAIGAWCVMFVSPRHGYFVLLGSTLVFVLGWLMIAFADVFADLFLTPASLAMLPHGLGLNI